MNLSIKKSEDLIAIEYSLAGASLLCIIKIIGKSEKVAALAAKRLSSILKYK